MAARLKDKKADLLKGVTDRLHEKLPADQAAMTECFVEQYYQAVPPDELLARDSLDLYGAALSHLRFGEQREPGTAKVRVYNPQIEQHGWQSTHTTVEIVTDDMPFLVDSASMVLNGHGLLIHLTIHPILLARRNGEGVIEEVAERGKEVEGASAESFMHFEIDQQSDPARLEKIRADVERVMEDVRASVTDWRDMLAKIEPALEDLKLGAKVHDPDEIAEVEAFLSWIADHNFTFLGYGRYDLIEGKEGDQLRRADGSGMGLLRREEPGSKGISRSFAALPPEIRKMARLPVPLTITKANSRSTVHRPVYLDYIGVRRFSPEGKVLGEHRFLGLFTSTAYNRNPRRIPMLRRKVEKVVARANLPTTGHSGKALANIVETYPRDELLQIGEEELFETVTEILHLQERQRIRLFVRRDPFARFVSCMIYVPRERYDTGLRHKFQRILLEAFRGTEFDYQVQLSESILARIQFILRTPEGIPQDIDRDELEGQLVEATRSWCDVLRDALIDAHGEEDGNRLFRTYGDAIPLGYQEQVPARAAVTDLDRIDRIARGKSDLEMSLYRALEDNNTLVCFKLCRPGSGIPLSDVLPVLENMGLRVLHERPYTFVTKDGRSFSMHDFAMHRTEAGQIDIDQVRDNFQESFARVWRGDAQNDGFNQLVLGAGLSWRQVSILRACCKYLLQVGSPFSQAYMEQTLANNAALARHLAELFELSFDPDLEGDRAAKLETLEQKIREELEAVANLDEDRIIRRYRRLIKAMLRTNYYQNGADGQANKEYLSFKIHSAAVPGMPLPHPAFEIFVYSPRMEGVHLRGGKVARGGIRWSDRREDFRTEILGLMKAQMVKNGVIVPVGAKGGFVVKQPPKSGGRAALHSEVVACYQTLMRGMLDITDNRVGEDIVPPARVVRYDDDDPYLVVAADKGTATFSDIANGISQDYGHWLGDAFASGGSAGYDHKGMGITARGAWESVKRHFRELGKDCQTEPFTAIGIGDMSGDVFGNGMLLSTQTRLVAAFDHRHIFIDPDPDPASSYEERKRLFELPRSTWDDYDRSKISAGGGVFPRTVKSITLSAEARQALDTQEDTFTPHELIQTILLAPVELFWNGGIGTYVKAAEERQAEAFDRANDPVRVNAEDLRCLIVGEGGNLGLTQKGRIAFARKGGRINTDSIDNSAGVDCSDHEVNIKILLGAVVGSGDMTGKQRDQLLAEMTDEVGDLVLRNNILQAQAISLAESRPQEMLDSQASFIRRLEASDRLNRALEMLPDEEEMAQRRQLGQGLFRPEIAVLVSYAKMTLKEELIASTLPDEPYLLDKLVKYFPRVLRKRFPNQIANHRLRREITATLVANSMVNRGLGEFVSELGEHTGRSADEIARAYIVARDAFSLVPLYGQLEMLGGKIGSDQEIILLDQAREALARGAKWFLRNLPAPIDVRTGVERFGPGVARVLGQLDDVLAEAQKHAFDESVERHLTQGIEDDLARSLAALPHMFPACEVVAVADQVGIEVLEAGAIYFALDAGLHLGHLRDLLQSSTPRTPWERLALAGLFDDVVEEQRRLTIQALTRGQLAARADAPDSAAGSAEERVRHWLANEVAGVTRWQQVLAEIDGQPRADLAMLAVVVRALNGLDSRQAA